MPARLSPKRSSIKYAYDCPNCGARIEFHRQQPPRPYVDVNTRFCKKCGLTHVLHIEPPDTTIFNVGTISWKLSRLNG